MPNLVHGRRPCTLSDLGSETDIIAHIGAVEARLHRFQIALKRIEKRSNVPDQTDEDDVLVRLQDVEIIVTAALHGEAD